MGSHAHGYHHPRVHPLLLWSCASSNPLCTRPLALSNSLLCLDPLDRRAHTPGSCLNTPSQGEQMARFLRGKQLPKGQRVALEFLWLCPPVQPLSFCNSAAAFRALWTEVEPPRMQMRPEGWRPGATIPQSCFIPAAPALPVQPGVFISHGILTADLTHSHLPPGSPSVTTMTLCSVKGGIELDAKVLH